MRHPIDLEALADLFAYRIALISDLIHIGLTSSLIARRCDPGGGWQHLMPGIVLLGKAPPTRRQRIHAALRYAGRGAIVTGVDALQLHGMRASPATGPVHILAPLRSTAGCAAVHVERTSRLPAPVMRDGAITAPLARAAVDTVRHMRSMADIRAVLSEVSSFVDPLTLHAELDAAPKRGTTVPRQVLSGLHQPAMSQ
ncbi:hypothetical protein Lesp02_19690 [Lentzea sp. NBRC 105346]|uniref:hypothetical protein n=1 Tax=Lentzea sp. NBRC 105346 TaxID=3032205 RepID=UPI0024A30D42|nr:hypothetical protein [Lentzea sp. NBRC 105346]GLZ29779.1 hypothetical protein Lesp02_19690 [Lentzea sp. NBRC 105346]